MTVPDHLARRGRTTATSSAHPPGRSGPWPSPRPVRPAGPESRPAIDRLLSGLGVRAEPIVHLASGRVVGHEVRATRRAPGRPTGSADLRAVLARLERSGSIAPVTDRLLALASRYAGRRSGTIHVDVSGADLACPHLPERIGRWWPERERSRLVLELTEHVRVEAGRPLRANLSWLRSHGTTVALDRFGEGFADERALALLLPATAKVGIPRQQPAGLGWCDETRSSLVCATAELRRYDVRAIAVGVEDRHALADAAACGFDLAQGPVFSRTG